MCQFQFFAMQQGLSYIYIKSTWKIEEVRKESFLAKQCSQGHNGFGLEIWVDVWF